MEMFLKAMLGACVLAPVLASCSGGAGGVPARFNTLFSVATDSMGNVYAADAGNSTIRKVTPAGVVSTVVEAARPASFAPSALFDLLATVASNGGGARDRSP